MKSLVEALTAYQHRIQPSDFPCISEQALLAERFLKLAEQGQASTERSHLPGHFTGSMLVANLELDQVLLTLHAKLGLWLQLGGHADGDTDMARVALKECEEESGLKASTFFPLEKFFRSETKPPIFDLDIHWIPERPKEPGHFHYDVRYLSIADRNDPIALSPESKDLRWIALPDAYRLCPEKSMQRQFDKLNWLRSNGGLNETLS